MTTLPKALEKRMREGAELSTRPLNDETEKGSELLNGFANGFIRQNREKFCDGYRACYQDAVVPLIEALEGAEAGLAVLVTELFGEYKHGYPALARARAALKIVRGEE